MIYQEILDQILNISTLTFILEVWVGHLATVIPLCKISAFGIKWTLF